MTRQTWQAASGTHDTEGDPDNILMSFDITAWPALASEPALTAGNEAAIVWSISAPDAAMGDGNFARFQWTSVNSNSTITTGGRVAVGIEAFRYADQSTGNLEVEARVKINNRRRLDALWIIVEDEDGFNHLAKTDVLSQIASDDTWDDVSATFDLSSAPTNLSESMRILLVAEGLEADDANHDAGLTTFDVEYIALRQYND